LGPITAQVNNFKKVEGNRDLEPLAEEPTLMAAEGQLRIGGITKLYL
jgi:hypothetical protein